MGRGAGGNVEGGLDLGCARSLKHGANMYTGRKWKARAEDEFAGFDGIGAEQRREVACRGGAGVNGEDALPTGRRRFRGGVPIAYAKDAPLKLNRGQEQKCEH
jgi:hypothetical protein